MIARARGFLLPAAIFLLVILSALGAYIVNISTGQRAALALDLLGERAYQAGYAGQEWARYKIWERYQLDGMSVCPANTGWGTSTYSLGFTGTETLGSFHATIECRVLETTNVTGINTSVFEIRVTACNEPQASEPRCPGASSSPDYVERQFQALIGI